jgi:small subunit ribosomal protein S4
VSPSFDAEISKDLPLYLSLIKKPINLLFSIDQFVFEFSKKTYQQKKTGEFFQQLKERKKLSLLYGDLTRKQLIKLFQDATKTKGYFSKNLLALLESRLDVVLYRSGLVTTIAEGRQLIKHKKVQVNQKFIYSQSLILKPGDIISLDKLGNQLNNLLETNIKKKQKKYNKDISSQFQKYLDSFLGPRLTQKQTSKKRTTKTDLLLKLPSKIFCNLLIQFICTRIKLRSFWDAKRIKLNSLNLQNYNDQKAQFPEKKFLTTFKWKSFSSKNQNLIKPFFLKKKSQQDFASEGCLQKKPLFWVKNLLQLEKQKKDILASLKKNNKQFSIQKTTGFQNQQDGFTKKTFGQKMYLPEDLSKNKQLTSLKLQKSELEKRKRRQEKYSNKNNIALFRKSFLLFLKHINSHTKFSSLLVLKIKNFLFKKSFYQYQLFSISQRSLPFGKKPGRYLKTQKVPFLKELNFRTIRPLNYEISYNLLNIIYLYSPQRVNFPFYIDFDLIKRSLR